MGRIELRVQSRDGTASSTHWGRRAFTKGGLESEFARQAGRESRPQGLEGHEERGDGDRRGQGRASLGAHPQGSDLSVVNLRPLSRVLIQGPQTYWIQMGI